jgi:stage II sporulation protein D
MKLICSLICHLAIVLIAAPLLAAPHWPYGYMMRMHCQADGFERSFYCTSLDGFTMVSSEGDLRRALDAQVLMCAACDSTLFLQMQPLVHDALWLDSPTRSITVSGITRSGSLYVSADDAGVTVVLIGSPGQMARSARQQRCDSAWGVTEQCARWSSIAHHASQTIKQAMQERSAPRHKKTSPIMRVLLDAHAIGKDACAWHLCSSHGFYVYDPARPAHKCFVKKTELRIVYKKNQFYLHDTRFHAPTLVVKTEQGYVTMGDDTYQGDFTFVTDKKRALCINCIDLESYVCSVLKSESWPGWPLEINKVLAIVVRSYAMAQMRTAAKSKRVYHVKNTNAHQTYRGVHTSEMIKKAVKETESLIMVYDSEPILAMFDSCCGGVIPMHIQDGIDFVKAPYLARSYACPYCKGCKIYQWQAEYDLGIFERHLCSELHTLMQLKDVTVTKRDKAGLVLEVVLRGNKAIKKISGRRLYSLLHDVKSYCFDISTKAQKIIVKGNGFGHHLGLCQWGAREMVRRGSMHQQILAFYYPKTHLMRLA